VVPDERIVLESVVGALYVHVLQGMARQLVLDDVLERDAQKAGMRHAEKFVQVSGVAGADLERPVNVEVPVGIAVGKDLHGQPVLVRQQTDEPAARPAG
jgi:hypothetical protein